MIVFTGNFYRTDNYDITTKLRIAYIQMRSMLLTKFLNFRGSKDGCLLEGWALIRGGTYLRWMLIREGA